MPAAVFTTAIDALFADPNLSVAAVYRAGGTDPGLPVRAILRRPDRIGEYGDTRIAAETLVIDIRVSEIAEPANGDTMEMDGAIYVIQGEPIRDAERAVTSGVRAASDGLKTELRGQIKGAGFGTRLANTWRGEVYPKGQTSIGAAGYIWSKAPGIVRLYAEGGIIRSRHGLYLAILLPAAGRFGDNRRKITPGSWERIHGLRLRFVYRRGRPSLLVADNARLTKRGRATANIGRRKGSAFTRLSGRTTVPVFVLVPQMTLRKAPRRRRRGAEMDQRAGQAGAAGLGKVKGIGRVVRA